MFLFHMSVECFLTNKLQVAWHTGKRLVYFVNHLMPLQLVFPCEGLPTMLTHKRSFSSMDNCMPGEFVFSSVALTAYNAHIRALSCVDSCVHTKPLRPEESLTTCATVEGEIVCMGSDVVLQFVATRKYFSTNIADFLCIPTSSSTCKKIK